MRKSIIFSLVGRRILRHAFKTILVVKPFHSIHQKLGNDQCLEVELRSFFKIENALAVQVGKVVIFSR